MGEGDSVVARSLSISRAERASVLRRISSPPILSENDEDAMSIPPSRASNDFSDPGSELDRHALISAEMDKLRSVHLHLLSTITEYKKQISVVKDRNLKLVATLLDRERVRLWTADGQDEVISAIVGQHSSSHNHGSHTNHHAVHAFGSSASSVGAISLGGDGSTLVGSSSGLSGLGGAMNLNPGVASGAKKHHHLSLTAAEDGIKLLRCQLERIRQSEMTRFTEMGIGLTMNYSSLYQPPSGTASVAGSVNGGPPESLGPKTKGKLGGGSSLGTVPEDNGMGPNGGATNAKKGGAKDGEGTFSKFEATLYSDLENRYSDKGF